jgi:hypothetical protein
MPAAFLVSPDEDATGLIDSMLNRIRHARLFLKLCRDS